MSDTFQKYAVQILDINMTFMCQMLTSLVTRRVCAVKESCYTWLIHLMVKP